MNSSPAPPAPRVRISLMSTWVPEQPQVPALHAKETQSLSREQPLPIGHEAQFAPPQSTSLSPLSSTPSVQLGAHFWFVHFWLPQSPSTAHEPPIAHSGHMPPPQSLSVSAPFCWP